MSEMSRFETLFDVQIRLRKEHPTFQIIKTGPGVVTVDARSSRMISPFPTFFFPGCAFLSFSGLQMGQENFSRLHTHFLNLWIGGGVENVNKRENTGEF